MEIQAQKDAKRKYETFQKLENGRWLFQGWYSMLNEDFCIETKTRGKYIYKTYKFLDGTIETYRYGNYIEEE